MRYQKEFIGETLGTFILVLLGCGSVMVSVLFNALQGIFQIAMIWGIGVMLAIYLTRHLSCAHLNPAVSIAMAASGRMQARKLPTYLSGQFVGAFLAGLVLLLLFQPSISAFEQAQGIVRGTPQSIKTAMMFGEFYPNPGSTSVVSLPLAMGAEAFGTFLLMLMVFALTDNCNIARPDDSLTPVFIGLTVTSIICLVAPLTQAGLNPARDFGPRLVSWMAGWGNAAFPDQIGGFFWVYMLAPVLGSLFAAFIFLKILQSPTNSVTAHSCSCDHPVPLKKDKK